jgi:8-oxo-dGTP diphosphatase
MRWKFTKTEQDMPEGRSLWLDVIPSSEADRSNGFDRRFDNAGNPPDWEGVAVLCHRPDDNALLMVLQAEPGETPTWALPGGAIEPGETLEQAAVREAREETGLEVQLFRPHLKVRGVYDNGNQAFSYHIYYFEAAAVGGTLQPDDPDGAIHEAVWMPGERLCDLSFSHDDQRLVLLHYVEAPCQ